MSENEAWYDKEIAPKLRELAAACHAREMSFLACVEYEPSSRAGTYWLTENAGLEMTMIKHCATTAPNIDSYVIGLARYCEERGIDTGGSLVMRKLI